MGGIEISCVRGWNTQDFVGYSNRVISLRGCIISDSCLHYMKKNNLINQADIKAILKYATDLPSLENKFRSLANTVLDLEIRKKELNAQIIDLRHVITHYQNAIDIKKNN